MIAIQTRKKPFSPSRPRSNASGGDRRRRAGARHHEEAHTALGVGSKRNTLWSSRSIVAPKMLRHEVVADLDVDADLVERLVADLLGRRRPAAAPGEP